MALPLVAIVGRPNVGKSTLFNHLAGQRLSITEPTPGVTRDRLYQEIEWQGQRCLLMDTGGLVPDSEEVMDKEISAQVAIALDTADLILFVVDGREGLNPMDQMTADRIRQSRKPVILVINKVNSASPSMTAYEFFELGFDQLIMISAEQGYGLGDLLDQVFDQLPEDQFQEEESDRIKLCLIGKPNVGKSSLVNRILGEDRAIVTDIPGTTRDSIDSYFTRRGKDYVIIDTAGLRKRSAIDDRIEKYSVLRTYAAVDRSDICIFMLDAAEGLTEQDTKIAGYAHNQGKASILVVNKWDLIEKETNTQRDYELSLREGMTFNRYAPVVFLSVLEGRGMDKLFRTIDQVEENYHRRISTGLLVQLVRDALVMNPPPTDKGKRLKIYYAAQVDVAPPKILFYCNDKKLFHFSYLRYLENQLRKNFDFAGVPLQLEVRLRKQEEKS